MRGSWLACVIGAGLRVTSTRTATRRRRRATGTCRPSTASSAAASATSTAPLPPSPPPPSTAPTAPLLTTPTPAAVSSECPPSPPSRTTAANPVVAAAVRCSASSAASRATSDATAPRTAPGTEVAAGRALWGEVEGRAGCASSSPACATRTTGEGAVRGITAATAIAGTAHRRRRHRRDLPTATPAAAITATVGLPAWERKSARRDEAPQSFA